jgi:hypothetical protein
MMRIGYYDGTIGRINNFLPARFDLKLRQDNEGSPFIKAVEAEAVPAAKTC